MMAKDPKETTAQVVKLLYDVGAYHWSIQDKGMLVGAVKLQLQERGNGKSTSER